jgi:hypothetical protein
VDWDARKAEHLSDEQTEGWLWTPAPGVIVTRARGVGSLNAIKWYTSRADRVMLGGRPLQCVFHDWAEITSFDPEARSFLRTWAAQRGTMLGEAHYLVSSKLLAMAVSAAALALGRSLKAHTDPVAFEAALDQRLAAAR